MEQSRVRQGTQEQEHRALSPAKSGARPGGFEATPCMPPSQTQNGNPANWTTQHKRMPPTGATPLQPDYPRTDEHTNPHGREYPEHGHEYPEHGEQFDEHVRNKWSDGHSDCERPDEDPTPKQQAPNANGSRPKMPTALITKVLPENKTMGEHESYHENITGKEAEKRLKKLKKRSYLTRYSEIEESYILTVFEPRTPKYVIQHYKIIIENGRCNIDGKERDFENIDELLIYYERNRIHNAFKNIGQKYTLAEHNDGFCTLL